MHVALDLPMLGRSARLRPGAAARRFSGTLKTWHLEIARRICRPLGGRAGAETPDDFVVAI